MSLKGMYRYVRTRENGSVKFLVRDEFFSELWSNVGWDWGWEKLCSVEAYNQGHLDRCENKGREKDQGLQVGLFPEDEREIVTRNWVHNQPLSSNPLGSIFIQKFSFIFLSYFLLTSYVILCSPTPIPSISSVLSFLPKSLNTIFFGVPLPYLPPHAKLSGPLPLGFQDSKIKNKNKPSLLLFC